MSIAFKKPYMNHEPTLQQEPRLELPPAPLNEASAGSASFTMTTASKGWPCDSPTHEHQRLKADAETIIASHIPVLSISIFDTMIAAPTCFRQQVGARPAVHRPREPMLPGSIPYDNTCNVHLASTSRLVDCQWLYYQCYRT